MAELQLSRRLDQLAQWVPTGSRVADIGSDHALLPCVLVLRGQASYAIAGEVNDGPYEAASAQIRNAGLSERGEARKGNGLAVLQPEDRIAVVTIAGMGGALICTILSDGLDKLAGVERLILQPNVGEDLVRQWLVAHDWKLEDETLLEEDGKFYEVLLAVRDADAARHNAELYGSRELASGVVGGERLHKMGPYLITRGGAVFHAKWQSENQKLRGIIRDLQQSDRDEARQRAAAFQAEIDEVEAILACLPMDKPSSNM